MGLSSPSGSFLSAYQSQCVKITKKSHLKRSVFEFFSLVDFQTLWNSSILLERRFSIWRTLVSIFYELYESRGHPLRKFSCWIQSSWVSTFVTVISLARACTTAVQVWNGYFPQGNFAQLSNKNIEVLSAGFQFPFRASYPIRISGRNSLLSCCFCYLNYGTCFAQRDSYSLGQTLESFVLLKLIKVIHGVGKLFEGKKVAENLVFFFFLCQSSYKNIVATNL